MSIALGILLYSLAGVFTGVLASLSWQGQFGDDPDPLWAGLVALLWPLTLPILTFSVVTMVMLVLVQSGVEKWKSRPSTSPSDSSESKK